jgi:predicted metal-dependent RNase
MWDDDAWMEMRAEARRFAEERNSKLIEDWCKECHVTTPIGYDNDYSGVMTIYTDRPGYLIGKGGEKVNKFKEALKKEFRKEYEVKFVEVRGGFVNLNIKEEC